MLVPWFLKYSKMNTDVGWYFLYLVSLQFPPIEFRHFLLFSRYKVDWSYNLIMMNVSLHCKFVEWLVNPLPSYRHHHLLSSSNRHGVFLPWPMRSFIFSLTTAISFLHKFALNVFTASLIALYNFIGPNSMYNLYKIASHCLRNLFGSALNHK